MLRNIRCIDLATMEADRNITTVIIIYIVIKLTLFPNSLKEYGNVSELNL